VSIIEQTALVTTETSQKSLVSVEYYTDPLCSWSWAFEPQWRRLRYECGARLRWHYRMGGLIADWQSFNDPFNDIRNPGQLGPQWLQVSRMSGMPLNGRLWLVDPPDSSYPACIAAKAAERQGLAVIESYLRRLREAVMLEGKNIARQEVLLAIAQEQSRGDLSADPARARLDFDRFYADLSAPEVLDAFRQDLRDAAYSGIGRFPTLILRREDGHGIVLVGYRPYKALREALNHLAPGLHPEMGESPEELATAYITHWGRVTPRELAEVLGDDCDIDDASTLLESLVTSGMLRRENNQPGMAYMYVPA
jgi:putative protein-disulfide isomerase